MTNTKIFNCQNDFFVRNSGDGIGREEKVNPGQGELQGQCSKIYLLFSLK